VNGLPSFAEVFEALWGIVPFPWQEMLAARLSGRGWPRAIDLPTAAGKTACIDAAVFALAAQVGLLPQDRTAPRRIWFVVDRRIVVDEAHRRAEAIAEALASAREGPLACIAARLRELSGTERPLATARLRGGMLLDDGWARIPSQPAVIATTVDQLGSRLLFRAYGHGHRVASVFAGLSANDSLILLDEAHCSVPFLQTLQTIEALRSQRWAETPIATPFAFAVLSATPPHGIPAEGIFPGAAREPALANATLQQRLKARKPAKLVPVEGCRKGSDPLVGRAIQIATAWVKAEGRRRVGLIVNRVATARALTEGLRRSLESSADVLLLTGRMRPVDRDLLLRRWLPYLRASKPEEPARPMVVVATQCLEVGADFSFDALVSECASLDSLRQRFGRLNRMGLAGDAPGVILARTDQVGPEATEPGAEDPIYGSALRDTWNLLNSWSGGKGAPDAAGVVDFGVESIERRLREVADLEDLDRCLAPHPDAPLLLPAHLDLLCQTSGDVQPVPDIGPFLHGKDRGSPEVRVVWRTDLDPERPEDWIDIVVRCPPVSGEMLSLPLYLLRARLQAQEVTDRGGDVEGEVVREEIEGRIRPVLVYRGRDHSRWVDDSADIYPESVVVMPAAYGPLDLGETIGEQALGTEGLDVWETARAATGKGITLRLQRDVLAPWAAWQPLAEVLGLVESPTFEREDLMQALDRVLATDAADAEAQQPPAWWLELLKRARAGRLVAHPSGGAVLIARPSADARSEEEMDLFADDDDWASAGGVEVGLDAHTEAVVRAVEKVAARCLPAELVLPLVKAARYHDLGKLDERFQLLLRRGDTPLLRAPIAKSNNMPDSASMRRRLREESGLPAGFRHEMLSAQIAESMLKADEAVDLIVHLIASHHGFARPFAPFCRDDAPPPISSEFLGESIALSEEKRRSRPMHRLDSNVPERFWLLTRRFGWWGLAYLEALHRLGDWYGSQHVIRPEALPRNNKGDPT